MQKKLKKGTVYQIRFYDHSVGSDKDVSYDVVGYFLRETKISYIFSHWYCNDITHREENYEYTLIIKSCITDIKEIKKVLSQKDLQDKRL